MLCSEWATTPSVAEKELSEKAMTGPPLPDKEVSEKALSFTHPGDKALVEHQLPVVLAFCQIINSYFANLLSFHISRVGPQSTNCFAQDTSCVLTWCLGMIGHIYCYMYRV